MFLFQLVPPYFFTVMLFQALLFLGVYLFHYMKDRRAARQAEKEKHREMKVLAEVLEHTSAFGSGA